MAFRIEVTHYDAEASLVLHMYVFFRFVQEIFPQVRLYKAICHRFGSTVGEQRSHTGHIVKHLNMGSMWMFLINLQEEEETYSHTSF